MVFLVQTGASPLCFGFASLAHIVTFLGLGLIPRVGKSPPGLRVPFIAMELPRINEAFNGKPYHYGYNVKALYKLNTTDKFHKKFFIDRSNLKKIFQE
jgi:hypothetical protein